LLDVVERVAVDPCLIGEQHFVHAGLIEQGEESALVENYPEAQVQA
jgi:hypothetical protein